MKQVIDFLYDLLIDYALVPTILITIYTFLKNIWNKKLNIRYETYERPLIKAIDHQILPYGYNTEIATAYDRCIITILLENRSSEDMEITFLECFDVNGSSYKSQLESSYLTFNVTNYMNLDGKKITKDNLIYSTDFPSRIKSNSFKVLTFVILLPSYFSFDHSTIHTNKGRKKLSSINQEMHSSFKSIRSDLMEAQAELDEQYDI